MFENFTNAIKQLQAFGCSIEELSVPRNVLDQLVNESQQQVLSNGYAYSLEICGVRILYYEN